MRTEKDIAAALRALAQDNSRIEARPELEARVLREYRRRLRSRGRLRELIALAAAAAIAVAIFAVRHPHAVNAPAALARDTPREVVPEIVNPPAPVVAGSKAVSKRPRIHETEREITTEFFPLLDAPPPVDRGELLRVMVPASTMRAVGLPVAEDRLADRVPADVLVSEDGLATAIRFVKYQ